MCQNKTKDSENFSEYLYELENVIYDKNKINKNIQHKAYNCDMPLLNSANSVITKRGQLLEGNKTSISMLSQMSYLHMIL